MTLIQFLDSFYMALCVTIGMLFVYKSLSPKKWAKFIFPLIFAVIFSAFYILPSSDILESFIKEKMIRQQIFIIISFLTTFLFTFICFKSRVRERAAAIALYLASSVSAELILTIILFSLGSNAINDEHSNLALRLFINNAYLVLFLCTISTVFYFFRNRKNHIPWQVTASAILLFISCVSLLMTTLNKRSQDFDSFKYICIICSVCLLFIILSIYVIAKYMNRQELFKQKFISMQQMQEMDIKYLNSMQEKSAQIRRIQHDVKDNISVLNILLNSDNEGNIEKAKEILSELDKIAEESKITFYSNNLVVNAVLTDKISQAKKDGIKIKTYIQIPEKFDNISDLDLNVLIINLLKNAIEACKKIPDSADRCVEFKMAVKGTLLILKTVNPYCDLKLDSKGNIKTTKKDEQNHGIGLSIIKSIVDKYHGTQVIKTQDNNFWHIVSLQIEK